MGWVITAAGALVVAVVLRDIFRTILSPNERGELTTAVTRTVWHATRRLRRRGRVATSTGPAAMLAVIGTWIVLVVLGWAAVYGPHLPEAFVLQSGIDPARRGGPLDAIYLSLVTLATLGFGDVVPDAGWLRVAVPLQALIGFAMITAATSWVLQIYPALSRRRTLAARLAVLDRAGTVEALPGLDAGTAAGLLDGLAVEVVQVRVDLAAQNASYYFVDVDRRTSLPAVLGTAVELTEGGRAADEPNVRAAAAVLACALEDLADVLDGQFLRSGGTTTEILAAYAADHRYGPG